MADSNKPSMKVSLLYHKESGRILYLEAGKDFVDLLMSLLRMHTAKLLNVAVQSDAPSKKPVGIFNIYSSTEQLEQSYMKADKEVVLNPSPTGTSAQLQALGWQEDTNFFICENGDHWSVALSPGAKCSHCQGVLTKKLQPLEGGSSVQEWSSFYTCQQRHKVANQNSATCPECHNQMSSVLNKVDSSDAAGSPQGFVKKNVTFMVTDNLQFYPSSTIRSIDLLNTQGVHSMRDLKSFQAAVTKDDALALVKASLSSTTALNDVFGHLVRSS